MTIWFVIYIGTQVGGSVGPLPYDMHECQLRAIEQTIILEQQLATGHDVNGGEIDPLARLMRFRCEAHGDRPVNTFGAGGSF